jgi:hypothetical protein
MVAVFIKINFDRSTCVAHRLADGALSRLLSGRLLLSTISLCFYVALWGATPFGLVGTYEQYVSPPHPYLPKRPDGVATQRNIIDIFTAVKTSHSAQRLSSELARLDKYYYRVIKSRRMRWDELDTRECAQHFSLKSEGDDFKEVGVDGGLIISDELINEDVQVIRISSYLSGDFTNVDLRNGCRA